MEKIKHFAERLASKVRNAKFAVGAVAASAALPVVSVAASAEGETGTSTGLAQYSDQITGTFSGMVNDIMPIAIGVLGTGATIFGLFIAFKLARRALNTVAK